MTTLLILPVIIPFATAILCVFAWERLRVQRALSLTGAVASMVVSVLLLVGVWQGGIQSVQIGSWPAPFGITLVADLFSAIMVGLAALMGLAVTFFSLFNIDQQRVAHGYYPLTNVLLMGVNGAFLTGDIFNLYVWFEVLLISSFVLLGLGGTQQQLQGTIKYVVINLVASTIFLSGIAMVYGWTGALNMADLALRLAAVAVERPGVVTTISMVFLVAFGIKGALFPLYFWLPASYHTPPAAVSSLFSGLLTKVGVYALIRVFTLLFRHDLRYTHGWLVVIAGLTMLVGVLGAVSQMDIRRILSFHIVSQIGYMVMGLGMMGMALARGADERIAVLAITGAVFYIIHHIVVKTNLFLISGVVRWLYGTSDLKKLRGIKSMRPLLAGLFAVSALSLAGVPPFSGFWAKLTLVQAGLQSGQYLIVGVSLLVSLLTLFSMTKIWSAAYWGAAPDIEPLPKDYSGREWWGHVLPVIGLAVVSVAIGFSAESIYTLSAAAAEQLVHSGDYIAAVLGP